MPREVWPQEADRSPSRDDDRVKADQLARVCALAMALPRRPAGELRYPSLRDLRR